MRRLFLLFFAGILFGLIAGCTTMNLSSQPPLETVPQVDLPRFMGDWYVHGYTPILVDKDAHNATETYALNSDGTISTTYRFRQGGFDGEEKVYTPKGFVHNTLTNAEWRMQFLWPFKAAYLIIYLDANYESTIIGVPNRNHAWIMSRSPQMDDATYADHLIFLKERGYDTTKIQRVPHQW